MKFILLIFILFGCASQPEPSGLMVDLDIEEVKPDKLTALTKQNLIHLAQVYHLEPFLYTKKIKIQSKARNQFHPVIVLNTLHAEEPHKLLGHWLHEEFHWWILKNDKNFLKALGQLKRNLPGKQKKDYLELAVCYLEFQSLIHFLEQKEARGIIRNSIQKERTHPWAYKNALAQSKMIKKILLSNKLIPEILI